MSEATERGRRFAELYRLEIGGSLEEAGHDLITDILLFIREHGNETHVEDARRISWANYEMEIGEQ